MCSIVRFFQVPRLRCPRRQHDSLLLQDCLELNAADKEEEDTAADTELDRVRRTR